MKSIGLLLLLLAWAGPSAAITIVICEDSRGVRTFQTTCPPGTTELKKKEYRTATTSPAVTGTAKPALVLYRVPACDTCDQVEEFLTIRNLQFTETDVSMDIGLQEKVKQMAGELQVPVLTVGDKVIKGYSRTTMAQALTESGHIAAGTE